MMQSSPVGKDPDGGLQESVRLAYVEVCKAHAAITDFRAKLLGLLPLASGAGFLILLTGRVPLDAPLTVIGIYGVAITFALFMYELRGIQTCKRLRDQAARLEQKMELPPECGQFRDRPRAALGGLVGVEAAGWIIYPAVLLSWVYLAGRSDGWWNAVSPAWLIVAHLATVAGAWLFVIRPKSEEPEEGT